VPGKTAEKEAVTIRSSRSAIMAIVAFCAAVFVAALDQTMVYTLMRDLMYALGIDVEHISEAAWIITGYLLGYTVAMPLFGRLADIRGRRIMTLVALFLFLVGSAFCSLGGFERFSVFQRLDIFVVARVIQAAGGGALVPIAMSAAADMFPLRRRALMLGIVGGAAEAGGVLGPLYGVALAALWYWPLIFIINIPLSLFLVVVFARVLRGDLRHPEYSVPQGPSNGGSETESTPQAATHRWWNRGRVDYGGAALMALTLAGVTLGLGTGSATLGMESASPVNWPWLVVGAVAFIAFVFWERLHPRPLVRLDFLRMPAFASANIANLLVGVGLIIGMAGISLYAQTLFGLSEIGAGLLLVELTLPIPIGAVIGGWIADRIGCRVTAVLGFLVAATGYLLVSNWPLDPDFWTKLTGLAIAGLGFGFVVGPIGTSATTPVGPKWMATGAALVTVSRMVGMAVGLAAISSWGVRRVNELATKSVAVVVRTPEMNDLDYQSALTQARLLDSLHHVFSEFFLIAAIAVAVAIIPALFFYNHREKGASGLPFLPH
jgi:MFS family permease